MHGFIRTTVILLLMAFCGLRTTAQNTKVDSLDKLISKAKSDTARINLTTEKVYALSDINFDSAVSLATKTIVEARAAGFYKGELKLRQRLAFNSAVNGKYQAAAEQLRFLEHFIKPSEDSADFASLYTVYGTFYGMQSKYDSSIIFLEKAIRIDERKAHNEDALNTDYSNIAIAYQQQLNYPVALLYQQKALKAAETINDEQGEAITSVNVASTYEMMGDTTRAERFFIKAVQLATKNQQKNIEMYAYTNLSSLYLNARKWQLAYEYAMKAAELGGEIGDQGIKAASFSKASDALTRLNKFDSAKMLAVQAIAAADSSATPKVISQAYSSMGQLLKQQHKWAEAIWYYEKSFAAIKDSDMVLLTDGEGYQELSECYEKTGNLGKALAAYKTYSQMKDSATSKNSIQKATELTMNYEFEKKNAVAKAEQEKKDAETAKEKSRQYFIIAALGIVALAVVIISLIQFRNNRQKQEANIALQHQKEKAENALAELKVTQTQLIEQEKMASLGELTAGIAHEIQNPLNFVNNFSETNVELLSEMKQAIRLKNYEDLEAIASDLEKNEDKINHHGKRADSIVKSMLQHSKRSTGEKHPTDINALSDEYLRLALHGMRAKNKSYEVTTETHFDDAIARIGIVPQDIGRVLLNLFNNAFYSLQQKSHQSGSDYKPIISVATKNSGNGIEILIKDNGTGMSKHVASKIFQPFFTTKPTGEGTGLGLSLSYDIVTKGHGGELTVESKEGEGAVFKIILPANTN